MYPTKRSRWCPTPAQLMILKDMYRGGIRNPKSAQIQDITAHLSHYGKIEAKNVFYWFQNHKAREKQRPMKKLMVSMINNPSPTQQNLPQLFYYAPVGIQPPQGGSENASPQMMIYSVKLDPVADRMFKTKISATKTDSTNKPLKTLQLFPTTPSCALKNEPFPTSGENPSRTSSDKP